MGGGEKDGYVGPSIRVAPECISIFIFFFFLCSRRQLRLPAPRRLPANDIPSNSSNQGVVLDDAPNKSDTSK